MVPSVREERSDLAATEEIHRGSKVWMRALLILSALLNLLTLPRGNGTSIGASLSQSSALNVMLSNSAASIGSSEDQKNNLDCCDTRSDTAPITKSQVLRDDVRRRRDKLRSRLAPDRAQRLGVARRDNSHRNGGGCLLDWDQNHVRGFVAELWQGDRSAEGDRAESHDDGDNPSWQEWGALLAEQGVDGKTLAQLDQHFLESLGMETSMASKLVAAVARRISMDYLDASAPTNVASKQQNSHEPKKDSEKRLRKHQDDDTSSDLPEEVDGDVRREAPASSFLLKRLRKKQTLLRQRHEQANKVQGQGITGDVDAAAADCTAAGNTVSTPVVIVDRLNLNDTDEAGKVDNMSSANATHARRQKWKPVRSLRELGHLLPYDKVKAGFPKAFVAPTPIQMWCWSVGLSGRDILATAETGSGKTLGYLVPMLAHILARRPEDGIDQQQHQLQAAARSLLPSPLSEKSPWKRKKRKGRSTLSVSSSSSSLSSFAAQVQSSFAVTCRPSGLVIAPTRELALQIFQVASKFLLPHQKSVGALYGGSGIRKQIEAISAGSDVIVTTPGRILDVMKNYTGALNLSDTRFLVLDEADRLMSMGFREEVLEIISYLHKDRQSLLLSATWPPSMDEFSRKVLKSHPVYIKVGKQQSRRASEAPDSIEQIVRVCTTEGRAQLLLDVLQEAHNGRNNRVLVFVKTKKAAEYVRELLVVMGHEAVHAMHGDLTQEARFEALNAFRTNRKAVLVATDIAARGLDIPGISVVVNYEMPQTIEQYVHRIGRTGRAGRRGLAYSLVTVNDLMIAEKLAQVLSATSAAVTPELIEICEKSKATRRERNKRHKLKMKQKALAKAVGHIT